MLFSVLFVVSAQGLFVQSWQDEVRLRLFLDSIGFSDLSAKKIKKWMPEDRRQFEINQERYFSVLWIPSFLFFLSFSCFLCQILYIVLVVT